MTMWKQLIPAAVLVGLLAGCGSAQPEYVDAGQTCTRADECPTLHCLSDGGIDTSPDAGGSSIRGCFFGKCIDRC
jgi:hypothetical protein